MLGLLHRTQIGTAPSCISSFFPRAKHTLFNHNSSVAPPHNRQIQCEIEPGSTASFRQFLFGLVRVYNYLPANVVQVNTVSTFQSHLQKLMKISASNDDPSWSLMFHADS